MKLKNLVYLAALAPCLAFAQAANISSTDGSLSGINLNASGVNAVATTYFTNNGFTFLHIRNNGAAVTGTVVTGQSSITKPGYGNITLTSPTFSIPSSTIVGPFPTARFNSANGTVGISFSGTSNVSVTAVRDVMDGR